MALKLADNAWSLTRETLNTESFQFAGPRSDNSILRVCRSSGSEHQLEGIAGKEGSACGGARLQEQPRHLG